MIAGRVTRSRHTGQGGFLPRGIADYAYGKERYSLEMAYLCYGTRFHVDGYCLWLRGKHAGKVVGPRFAEGMEVQAFHAFGESAGLAYHVGRYSEPRAGQGRVVDIGLYHRALGIDSQSGTHSGGRCARAVALKLAQGVERDVVGTGYEAVYGGVGVDGAIAVGLAVEVFVAKLQLVERGGCEAEAVIRL